MRAGQPGRVLISPASGTGGAGRAAQHGDLLRGDTHARLPELANWTLPPPGGVRQARLTVLRAALNWYGQGSDLTATIPALRALLDVDDPHALALITIVTEQALVDRLYATDPPTPMIGPATPSANLTELAAELPALAHRALDSPTTPARDWRDRLRCALADAALERCRRTGEPASVDQAYGQLIADTTAGRILPGLAAVVHARACRAHAAADEPDQAIESWRRAVIAALPDFGGDAREAFQSLTQVVDSQGRWFVPDLERISQAVPNRRTFLGAAYDPAVAALDDLRGGRAQSAFRNARRCVWEARLSGHLYDEGWALTVFADVMKATGLPAAELTIRVTAGDGKNAAAVAATISDWVDLRDELHYGPPWVVAAAAQALAAEANLVPDDVLDQATADHPGSPGDAAGNSTGRLPRCVIVPLPVAASRSSFRRRMRSAAPHPRTPLARVAAPTRQAGKVNGLVSAPGGRSVFPRLARQSGRVAHPSHPRICRCRR